MSNVYITGLVAAQQQLQTISANVANANTDGFKGQTARFSVLGTEGGPGLGVRAADNVIDFGQGSLRSTGKALDLAISGRGFFVTLASSTNTTGSSGSAGGAALDTTSRLTRNGAFKMDKDGYIVDLQGRKLAVEGTTGGQVAAARVDLNGGASSGFSRIEVRQDAEIFAIYGNNSSATLGKVAVANLQDPSNLVADDSNSYTYITQAEVPSISTSGGKGRGSVISGMLEGSNVDLTKQLVDMITAQRNYQATAKGLSATDVITQTIINLR